MTPEDWKMVEDALSSPYGRVEFKIDGYDITIMCVVEKPLQYMLMEKLKVNGLVRTVRFAANFIRSIPVLYWIPSRKNV